MNKRFIFYHTPVNRFNTYSIPHNIKRFFDNIIESKRFEMFNILKKNINETKINSLLDIGTTEENELKSSNFFVNKFAHIKEKKSISDQNIKDSIFSKILKKSFTTDFQNEEIEDFKSDLVISSATIEHVGSYENQLKIVPQVFVVLIVQLTSLMKKSV